jgi:GAF domain-containing protein
MPEFVPDLSSHPKLTADGQTGPAGRLVALPLRSGGRLVGVTNLAFAPGRAFSLDDQALLERLNEQAAVVINSAWLFETTRRQVRELTALHLVSIATAEATGEDELIGRATHIISAELFPDIFGILLLDPTVGGLRLHPFYHGVDDRAWQ